jgi:hypothetical protein
MALQQAGGPGPAAVEAALELVHNMPHRVPLLRYPHSMAQAAPCISARTHASASCMAPECRSLRLQGRSNTPAASSIDDCPLVMFTIEGAILLQCTNS